MAIQIRNLSFGYQGKRILDNINLEIEDGNFTVIIGRNGCGKSTLLRLMAGFLEPQQGEISFLGRPLHQISCRERARLFGYLPQHHRPIFPFRVKDVVLTGRAGQIGLMPGKKDHRQAEQALEMMGIENLKERFFTELSGGEQQLVMIARVIAQRPRIILFDEPTTHLDFFYQEKVMCMIRELARMAFTVVAVLHDPNIAAIYGHSFVCLKDNRIQSYSRGQGLEVTTLMDVYGMLLDAIPFKEKTFVFPLNSQRR